MALKFVYVLVSTENDFIVEQTLVSIHSLRMYNPKAYVSIVLDKVTLEGLSDTRAKIKEYANEIITPDVPDGLSAMQKSRYIKTSIREIVEGDLLYIDNDTVILGNLDGLENLTCDVGAVEIPFRGYKGNNNRHSMLNGYQRITGKDIEEDTRIDIYLNGGVILAKDTKPAHDFFAKWHELWWKSSTRLGYDKDQPDMWKANKMLGNMIEKLDWEYNCMAINQICALQFLNEAKIFHYFSSSGGANHIKLKDPSYLSNIRGKGITKETEDYIRNLKQHYQRGIEVLMGNEIEEYYSPIVAVARNLHDNRILNRLIIFIAGIYNKIKLKN